MDQCSLQPIYTEEATEDAKQFVYSKLNYCGVDGSSVKTLGNVSYMGLFCLTRKRY